MNSNASSLAIEIMEWIYTIPTVSELQFYVENLPDENREVIWDSCRLTVIKLQGEKKQYFNALGMEWFSRDVTESQQLALLALMVSESPQVFTEKVSQLFPGYPVSLNDSSQGWAEKYVGIWHCACILLALTEMDEMRLILAPLSHSITSTDQLLRLSEQLDEQVQINVQITKDVFGLTADEKVKFEQFAADLGFIPRQEAEKLETEVGYYDRQILLIRLGVVFAAMRIVGVGKPVNAYELMIMEQCRSWANRHMLEVLEPIRHEERGDFRRTDYYVALLEPLLNESSISSGASEQRYKTYLQQIDSSVKEEFKRYTREFISFYPAVQLGLDPFSVPMIVDKVASLTSRSQLVEISEELYIAFDASEYPYLDGLLSFIYSVVHE